jgi:hypothetical protein
MVQLRDASQGMAGLMADDELIELLPRLGRLQ